MYLWEENGEPRAYLAYTVGKDEGKRTLHVTDIAYCDHDGLRQLLRFLANHESQIDRVALRAPPDWPLFGMVNAPQEIDCTLHPGPMVRLVDVSRALETVRAPDDRLVIAVSDPLAPWNDRTLALSEDGCEPTDEEPAVELDIGTLSQLFVGSRPLSTLKHLRECSIHDDRSRNVLESLFPSRRVYLGEHF